MIKVMQAFGVKPNYKVDGDLGVEVEVEGVDLPRLDKYWNTEHDSSLRGECAEYVLNKPLKSEELSKALNYLDKAYKKANTQVHDSIRAGVHVHVNVQELSIVELFNFMTAYLVMEEILTKYCGEYREGNLFCLRAKDADWLIYELERAVSRKYYNNLNTDMLRYAAMNVKSLSQYGSLEFRAMRGTRDLSIIENWANILLGIRDKSVEFNNPQEILHLLNEKGTESFLEVFLGSYKDILTDGIGTEEELDTMLSEGSLMVSNLVWNTDWDSFKTINIGGLEFPEGTEFPDEPVEDV